MYVDYTLYNREGGLVRFCKHYNAVIDGFILLRRLCRLLRPVNVPETSEVEEPILQVFVLVFIGHVAQTAIRSALRSQTTITTYRYPSISHVLSTL